MRTRSIGLLFGLVLSVATVSSGEDQEAPRPPQALGAAEESGGKLSKIEHLRKAAENLEAAGLADEAAELRSQSEQLSAGASRELEELTRQIAELQKKAAELRKLTGRPDQILCRCRFLELSPEAAEELAKLSTEPRKGSGPVISVYKNPDEIIQRLRAAGKLKVLAEQQIVTTPGKPADLLAGGEFPILLPTGAGKSTIEWRRFGLSCKIVAHLLGEGRVRLEFVPEIAERNTENSITLAGFTVPGLTIRRVHTQVEMNLGETSAVSLGSHPKSPAKSKPGAEPSNEGVALFMVTVLPVDSSEPAGDR